MSEVLSDAIRKQLDDFMSGRTGLAEMADLLVNLSTEERTAVTDYTTNVMLKTQASSAELRAMALASGTDIDAVIAESDKDKIGFPPEWIAQSKATELENLECLPDQSDREEGQWEN